MPTYKDEKTGRWYCKFVYTDWSGMKKQKEVVKSLENWCESTLEN